MSIVQLGALYDAWTHERYVWAVFFGATWPVLVGVLSGLIMLTREEE